MFSRGLTRCYKTTTNQKYQNLSSRDIPYTMIGDSNTFLWIFGAGIGVSAFLYGVRYLRTRTWINIKSDPVLSKKSLKDKVIIITGANTGLGKSAALDFAQREPAKIILACRNIDSGNKAAREITKCTGNSNVKCLRLDLASLDSIRQFAEQFQSENEELHALVCNAGVWFPMEQKMKSNDGYEIHFGVNHLGHFLLATLLKEQLLKAATRSGDARIVVVSSGLMNMGVVDMNNIDFENGRKSNNQGRMSFAPTGYCDSKLMNGLFVKEWCKREPKIPAFAVGPGMCKTELARNVHFPLRRKIMMIPFLFLFVRSSHQGAQNIIHATVQDLQKLQVGGFYRDGKLSVRENEKLDSMSDTGIQLYEVSEKLTKLHSE